MKLKYIISVENKGRYSVKEVIRNISETGLIRKFKHSLRDISDDEGNSRADCLEKLNDQNGYISSKVSFGKQIVMMDIDHKDFKDETVSELKALGIAFTVIESSENRYWIIVDKFTYSKYNSADFISKFVGIDPKYTMYSRAKGFCLRAFPQNGFTPEIVEQYGDGSTCYLDFIEAWKSYWKMPHIQWMIREFVINSI